MNTPNRRVWPPLLIALGLGLTLSAMLLPLRATLPASTAHAYGVPPDPRAAGLPLPTHLSRGTSAGWEEVGAGSATAGGISNDSRVSREPSVAIAPDGTPYVSKTPCRTWMRRCASGCTWMQRAL